MVQLSNLSRFQKIALVGAISLRYRKLKRKNKRRWWTRPWILRREYMFGLGTLSLLFNELQYEDPESYFNFLRMDFANFEYLLEKVETMIKKQDTNMRQSISARDRLAITLRYLATGETFKSLMYSTRVEKSTISKIVMETCRALYLVLKEEYLKVPKTQEEWEVIQQEFDRKWNFGKCFGALDGKHITFRASRRDGSLFYNYKGENSIVFLALVDANYRFLCIDIGVNGRVSDGGVFRESTLYQALECNLLNLPNGEPLHGRKMYVPPVIVADDAFPLRTYLMKPYPQKNLTHDERIFNYRLSRARMVVENAFGIFSNRFGIFLNKMNVTADKVKIIALASCALHNYLIQRRDSHYFHTGSVDRESVDGSIEPGSWRSGRHFNQQIAVQGGNRASGDALLIRNELKEFFNNEGKVSWQESRI